MSYAGPGLSPRHLDLFVIRPVLAHLAGDDAPGIDRDAAVELLLGTAAHESGLRALDQITGASDRTLGPAFGLYQIEPRTHDDVWDSYLRHRPRLAERVAALRHTGRSPHDQLASNLDYATAIARLVYFRSSAPLALPGNIAGHAAVWKRVYNTELGKGRPEQFVDAWNRLVKPYL